jgi:hypothetical protein
MTLVWAWAIAGVFVALVVGVCALLEDVLGWYYGRQRRRRDIEWYMRNVG